MKNKFNYYQAALEKKIEQSHYRQLRCVLPLDEAHILREEKRMVNFASNDYLGLSHHPFVKKQMIDYVLKWGAGSSPSRLISSHLERHQKIESDLAKLIGRESALLFPSGFQPHNAILSTLANSRSQIFIDRFSNTGLFQAAFATQAAVHRFEHNDLFHLRTLLENQKKTPHNVRLIITESLFNNEGEAAPLRDLAALAEEYEALLYVDDTHSIGLQGSHGMGLSSLYPGIDFVVGTFSKACGSFGGFVGLSQLMKEYLINFCPNFMNATALPPAILGAIDGILQLIPDMGSEREELEQRCLWLRSKLKEIGFSTGQSYAHIIPLMIGSDREATELFDHLSNEGILTSLIKSPTVPPQTARLRIALNIHHKEEHLTKLLYTLQNLRHTNRKKQLVNF